MPHSANTFSVVLQLQDVIDNEHLESYSYYATHPNSDSDRKGGGDGKGFVVRDAPWSKAPDMSSTSDFPEFGANAGAAAPKAPAQWGPWRK